MDKKKQDNVKKKEIKNINTKKTNKEKVKKPTHEELLAFTEYLDRNPPPPTKRKDIKQSILSYHHDNKNYTPITYDEIKTKFFALEHLMVKPGLSEIKEKELLAKELDKEPKNFALIISQSPRFLFSDMGKELVLYKYQQCLYGEAKERNRAKKWLIQALIPEKKRGRNKKGTEAEVKKARKYSPEFIAEIYWHLLGYFEVIRDKLKELKKKHKGVDVIILNQLYKIRLDLPKNMNKRYLSLLVGDNTPRQLAISETIRMFFISKATVENAVYLRKKPRKKR